MGCGGCSSKRCCMPAPKPARQTCPPACGPPNPLQVIDKVGFIMNNITMSNIDTKIRELNALVKPDLHPWFANYLVVKRAAQEPNFHAVYVSVAEKWNDKKLKDIFVRTTIHYLKVGGVGVRGGRGGKALGCGARFIALVVLELWGVPIQPAADS